MLAIVGGNLVAHDRVHHAGCRAKELLIFVFLHFAVVHRLGHARQRTDKQTRTNKNMTQFHLGTYLNLAKDKVLSALCQHFSVVCNAR